MKFKVQHQNHSERRAAEYPPLAEFADAFYWQQRGDDAPMSTYLAKVDAVKARFPKKTLPAPAK